MKENIRIKKAQKKDLDQVMKIWVTEFRKTPWNERWTKEKVKKTIKNYEGKVYVAVIDNNVVGFALVTESYYIGGPVVVLENLVVSNNYQEQGVGSILLKYVERIYKKKRFAKVFLNTIKKTKSYKFYKKRGYKNSKYDVNLDKRLK